MRTLLMRMFTLPWPDSKKNSAEKSDVAAVPDDNYILSSLFQSSSMMHSVLHHDNIVQSVCVGGFVVVENTLV